jgi:nickel-dependent lactate racemase
LIRAIAEADKALSPQAVGSKLEEGLGALVAGEKVLVLIPDHTRTIPMPMLFPVLVEALRNAAHTEFMVALGTHPPLDERALNSLLGLSPSDRSGRYRGIKIGNHAWEDPGAISLIGTISSERVREVAGDAWHPTLDGDVDIKINSAVLRADRVVIVGPTFPHEVAGFSGGSKYLFPGVSGSDIINVTHWLGALSGIIDTIGMKHTPVRALIDEAAGMVETPITMIALVVESTGVKGLFIGGLKEAWSAAAELSKDTHIVWLDQPLNTVISWAPPMYDELWTAAKAMYKLEPALAPGAEITIYAPHLDTVSRVHGKYIHEIGYHVLPYFLEQWERFREVPLGVLAHSTHVKGAGTFRDGVERPRVDVKLASKISSDDCRHLNLEYVDPLSLDPEQAGDNVFVVRKAGEMLYRVKS